jgi:hypothetical protein
MPLTIERASISDAKAIADVYQDRPITAWNSLTHGTVQPAVLNAGLEEMFAESLQDPEHEVLFVARDADHPERRVVSYVNLVLRPALVPMTEEVRTALEHIMMHEMRRDIDAARSPKQKRMTVTSHV